MLENAIREPFEDTIENIRQILRNSRRITNNLRRTGINQPIAKPEWDTPNWPITTADIPADPPEENTIQPTLPTLWLIILLIIPLIVAMLYAHFLCKKEINSAWIRYTLSQLPFIGSALVLLFLFFTWNPELINLVSMLTVIILAIVLLVEELLLLVYITKQCCNVNCHEENTSSLD
ncbi:MAG TPA: hypothetical protein DGN60_08125 [Chloroflexi bacterium]|nr:hypothetical protein [Chloroflexota bacterium]